MIEFRSFKNYNRDLFVVDFYQVPWHIALNNCDDIDDCVDTWNKCSSRLLDHMLQLKQAASDVLLFFG